MSSLCVFGAQWGDEGKGKIIDSLAHDADVIVRYQGGSNAGHTVIVGAEKYVLHLIPSGILHKGKVNVIGSGVAIDPLTLLEEIAGLRERGVSVTPDNLRIAANAHVIFTHHKRIDGLAERWRGSGRIGTTGRGIGPCYADKAARTGLRICDLLDQDRCRERLTSALAEKNALIEKVHGEEPLSLDEELGRYAAVGDALRPFVRDTGAEVRDAYAAGQRVLFEGAQGMMLDLDHGTYPFVTSSSTGVGGISSGAGFSPRHIERVVGIAKAYCTRVGEGPFPTELTDETGARIQKVGNEFGATTGRPRRAGWFDAVAVRYAFDLCGADGWVATKLDILSGFETLRVGVSYEIDGETFERYPAHLPSLDGVQVTYKDFPGWQEDIADVRSWEDLPEKARGFVEALEDLVACPVDLVSVGPDREAMLTRPK